MIGPKTNSLKSIPTKVKGMQNKLSKRSLMARLRRNTLVTVLRRLFQSIVHITKMFPVVARKKIALYKETIATFFGVQLRELANSKLSFVEDVFIMIVQNQRFFKEYDIFSIVSVSSSMMEMSTRICFSKSCVYQLSAIVLATKVRSGVIESCVGVR